MECERFKRLLKTWYIQVQSESLAPARMVDFMESHVTDCPVCLMDPAAKKDIAKIITLILPQDKLRQTPKSSSEADDLADDLDDTGDSTDDEVVDNDETDEESDDDKESEDDDLEEDADDEE